jgi:hypothetical protein
MNAKERTSLPTCDEWIAQETAPMVAEPEPVPDIPLELLPTAQIGERIWPRVFPGL